MFKTQTALERAEFEYICCHLNGQSCSQFIFRNFQNSKNKLEVKKLKLPFKTMELENKYGYKIKYP